MSGRYYLSNNDNWTSNGPFIIANGASKSNNFYYKKTPKYKPSRWFGQILSFDDIYDLDRNYIF